MRNSIAIAGCLCAGLFAGCFFNDPGFVYPHLLNSGSTAQQQAEAQWFDPYPDPTLSHSDGGMRPLGYEEPRDVTPLLRYRIDSQATGSLQPGGSYPLQPPAAPIVITPAPTGTITAPYPSARPYPMTAPGSFPAASPAPYPGATPNSGVSPNFAPTPGPAPAPYVLPQ
jgi:hypothetical protein